MASIRSVFDAANDVLHTPEAVEKANLARLNTQKMHDTGYSFDAPFLPTPERPARADQPVLTSPANMPRRRLGTVAGRIALLHAVAHIELNAIDLAFDMLARFGPKISKRYQRDFILDWMNVGDDEARHFMLVQNRLHELGAGYGALPAHGGLWEAAQATKDDVLARLAIAPLVLEARGLDVTPKMIENLTKVGDHESADILKIIYDDEIGHVGVGVKWMKNLSLDAGHDPKERFRYFVKTRFNGSLKEPFNHKARSQAGFDPDFYLNITH